MESHCTMRLLVPCLLLLISATFIDGFQSDELSVEEDDSEATPVTAPVIEKPVLRQSVSSAGEVLRSTGGASADGPTHDRKIEFNVEHAFGDSRFTPAGMISARLRTTSQGRQVYYFPLAWSNVAFYFMAVQARMRLVCFHFHMNVTLEDRRVFQNSAYPGRRSLKKSKKTSM